ncbi:putative carboxylesterase [Xylariaceae sp. FL0255]|nr:putative carboxylesterase [Xylariaceae sp. FL0255]
MFWRNSANSLPGYRRLPSQTDLEYDSIVHPVHNPHSRLRSCAIWFKAVPLVVSLCLTIGALYSVLNARERPSVGYDVDGRPIVHTLNGTYAGIHLNTLSQDVFLGIPYAIPPLGTLRFRRPQSLNTSWDDVRNATAYTPQCPGYSKASSAFSQSEDCLTINVVRPSNVDQFPLPVAVFIYGAGVRAGSSGNPRYNLSFIVSMAANSGLPFIGVSLTYRGAIGGWLISDEMRGSENTNIAFHDQRMALRWVQDNIAAFGGDPRTVTLWGGSSGARDVGFHLTAYGGRDDGLFRAAILQSGSPVEGTSNRRYPVQELYNSLVTSTRCASAEDSLDCLRHLPYEEIVDALETSPYGMPDMTESFGRPCIDGGFLRRYGSLSLKGFQMVNVPVLSGYVTNEGGNQIPGFVRDWAGIRGFLTDYRLYPPTVVDRLMSFYPPVTPGMNDTLEPPLEGTDITSRAEFERIEHLMGDLSTNSGARLLCGQYSILSTCYGFRFDAMVSSVYDERLGVHHGDEIGPVFQAFDGVGWLVNPFSGKGEGLLRMSQFMGVAWAGFITALDPNVGFSSDSPVWPKYSATERLTMVFNASGSWVEEDYRRSEALDFIDSIQDTVLER